MEVFVGIFLCSMVGGMFVTLTNMNANLAQISTTLHAILVALQEDEET